MQQQVKTCGMDMNATKNEKETKFGEKRELQRKEINIFRNFLEG